MRRARALVVGFAAETTTSRDYARGKLRDKRVDLIAANRVGVAGSGFESDDNALTVFWRDGDASTRPGAEGAAGRRPARPRSRHACNADAMTGRRA